MINGEHRESFGELDYEEMGYFVATSESDLIGYLTLRLPDYFSVIFFHLKFTIRENTFKLDLGTSSSSNPINDTGIEYKEIQENWDSTNLDTNFKIFSYVSSDKSKFVKIILDRYLRPIDSNIKKITNIADGLVLGCFNNNFYTDYYGNTNNQVANRIVFSWADNPADSDPWRRWVFDHQFDDVYKIYCKTSGNRSNQNWAITGRPENYTLSHTENWDDVLSLWKVEKNWGGYYTIQTFLGSFYFGAEHSGDIQVIGIYPFPEKRYYFKIENA